MESRDEKRGVAPRMPSTQVGASGIDQALTLIDLDIDLGVHGQALERILEARSARPALSPEESFLLDRRQALCLERLGRTDEARIAARAALDAAPPGIPPIERVRCLLVAGKAALELGNLPAARADATAMLETLGEGATALEAGLTRNLLGAVALRSGEPDLAREHFEKGLEIFRKLGDLHNLAGSYVNLGSIHKLRCDWERAAEHYHVAYYLGTTQGEYGRVAGAAQNLGIVFSKTGRYQEARVYIERGLKLAIERGDAVRLLRARLALARIDRTERHTHGARKLLAACRTSTPLVLPEREHCLLILEEARLDLDEAAPHKARSLAGELRLRVEAMAPRGDLMVEALLLEADIASGLGDWGGALSIAMEALDLARADRDRAQEERASLRLARAWARCGKLEDARGTLAGLAERHRSRSEWPALASILLAEGEIAIEMAQDPGSALDLFKEAAEIYRRLGLPRPEALADARRAAALIGLSRRDEALALVEMLHSFEAGEEPFPALDRALADLTERLRSADQSDLGGLDGLKVHERLEEILASKAETWSRLREILTLMSEALEVDGALLGRARGSDLEILAFHGIDQLSGKKVVTAQEIGLPEIALDGARLHLDLSGGGAGSVGSRLTIPIAIRGRQHLLHLWRRPAKGRGPLSRGERNYALVLAAEVGRALEIATPEGEAPQLERGIALADVITQDPALLKILELIRKIGDTGLSVLLQGETGTGKKLLANAIHRASGRRNRPFVTVDCAALPETLLEAELFGYRKGAFTGASQDRSGLLAEASGGTVFLDEIDKAGLTVQRRFLHLLDSGEIRPVGSTSYQRLDVRIICATSSPDLRTEVASGLFLKDLYYRLNDISIEIPPLRERMDDVLLLAGCFMELFAEQTGRRVRGMTAAFRRALLAHDWPGNVRELEKAIRRAVTLADDDVLLTPDLLPREVTEGIQESEEDPGDDLKKRLEIFERRALEQALDACDGNKSRAASLLGLSRKGLKGKLARYRIGSRFPKSG